MPGEENTASGGDGDEERPSTIREKNDEKYNDLDQRVVSLGPMAREKRGGGGNEGRKEGRERRGSDEDEMKKR